MMNRIKKREGLVENDLEYRDVIFKNTLNEGMMYWITKCDTIRKY